MALTETEISNFSLAMLGSRRISDITDTTSKNARIANLHYAQARKECLRSHRWNWSILRASLTQHADSPEYGYAYQYPLPTNFLRLDSVNEVAIWESQRSDFFELEQGQDSSDNHVGPVILTNSDTIRVRYVADITDTSRYDPLFTDALAVLLAAKMARAITGSDNREKELREQYESMSLPRAQQVDGSETSSGENPPLIAALSGSYLVNARKSLGLDITLPTGPLNPTALPLPGVDEVDVSGDW